MTAKRRRLTVLAGMAAVAAIGAPLNAGAVAHADKQSKPAKVKATQPADSPATGQAAQPKLPKIPKLKPPTLPKPPHQPEAVKPPVKIPKLKDPKLPSAGRPSNSNTGNSNPGSGATPTPPVAQPATVSPPTPPAAATPAPTPPPAAGDDRSNSPSESASPKKKSSSKPRSQSTGASSGSGVDAATSTGTSAAVGGSAKKERNQDKPKTDESNSPPSVITKFVKQIPLELRLAVVGLSGLVLLLGLISLRERRRLQGAQRDARADALTGIANRLAFEQRLAAEWNRSQRYGRPLGLILVDLDDFKAINDNDGHAAGDRVLRQVAEKITERVRETDFVARLGGDEFVVICPETGAKGLDTLARELREEFEPYAFGASVGFAELERSVDDPDRLLAIADESMYRDKRERITARERGRLTIV